MQFSFSDIPIDRSKMPTLNIRARQGLYDLLQHRWRNCGIGAKPEKHSELCSFVLAHSISANFEKVRWWVLRTSLVSDFSRLLRHNLQLLYSLESFFKG